MWLYIFLFCWVFLIHYSNFPIYAIILLTSEFFHLFWSLCLCPIPQTFSFLKYLCPPYFYISLQFYPLCFLLWTRSSCPEPPFINLEVILDSSLSLTLYIQSISTRCWFSFRIFPDSTNSQCIYPDPSPITSHWDYWNYFLVVSLLLLLPLRSLFSWPQPEGIAFSIINQIILFLCLKPHSSQEEKKQRFSQWPWMIWLLFCIVSFHLPTSLAKGTEPVHITPTPLTYHLLPASSHLKPML